MGIRVLIADDNSLMRSQIRALLHLDTDVDLCAEAVDGIDAVRRSLVPMSPLWIFKCP
jgi:chemotaxis response regulator CheB